APPIANTITAAHVVQRYLRPDVLAEAQVHTFDAWAATFGQQVTALEVSPDGGKFRMKTRFAKFSNVPELIRLFHTFADVKTAEDLKLPVPALRTRPGDGKRAPDVVRVLASADVEGFVRSLGERADLIQSHMPKTVTKVDGSTCDDSMLLVSNDGRRAATDM